MNHKQKVIAAIRYLECQQNDAATQRQRLAAAEQAKKDMETVARGRAGGRR